MRELDLETLVLTAGAHAPGDQFCIMEATAYIAGEPWSDHPRCVSPVLGAFGRAWNDSMRSDAERDALKQYIPRMIGTAGDSKADKRRASLAIDWLVRVYTPAFLRLAKLDEHADRLAALPPTADEVYAASVQDDIAAAWAAAEAAATADWAASRAASAASRAASAVSRAAWSAAEAASASMAVSWAVWAASRAASAASRAAVGAADVDTPESTISALQASMHMLFERMIAASPVPERWPDLVYPEEDAK